jgi:hypothetical protein
MADVFLFIQNGWKNIWKQSTIWFFSVLPAFGQFLVFIQSKQAPELLNTLLTLVVFFIYMILLLISFIGVSYSAYSLSIDMRVTDQEVLIAIRQFATRVIGCSCIGLLLFVPLFIGILAISAKYTTHPFQTSDNITLLLLPLSAFSALGDFILFGFFANDWNIRQSAKNAWALYTAHFGILATLGIIMMVIYRIYYSTIGLVAILIQSGLDMEIVRNLNLFNPAASLNKDILFTVLIGTGITIFTPFRASTLAMAYRKYSEAKLPTPEKLESSEV